MKKKHHTHVYLYKDWNRSNPIEEKSYVQVHCKLHVIKRKFSLNLFFFGPMFQVFCEYNYINPMHANDNIEEAQRVWRRLPFAILPLN
jgi:hypothetical protein